MKNQNNCVVRKNSTGKWKLYFWYQVDFKNLIKPEKNELYTPHIIFNFINIKFLNGYTKSSCLSKRL